MGIADGVDIVVLNYNGKDKLERCIDSIKHNTDGEYSLIIVDQNSRDGSKEWMIENHIASHLILNKRNVGVAEGKNLAIRGSNHPWIAFIDSDIEIVDPNWLDKMWNYTIDRKVGLIEARVKTVTPNEQYSGFGRTSFCMIRRQCLNEIGHFDKRFFLREDIEWGARLEWSWWKRAYCFDTVILHHREIQEGNVEHIRLMDLKYSQEFLKANMWDSEGQRIKKEEELIHGNSNG